MVEIHDCTDENMKVSKREMVDQVDLAWFKAYPAPMRQVKPNGMQTGVGTSMSSDGEDETLCVRETWDH